MTLTEKVYKIILMALLLGAVILNAKPYSCKTSNILLDCIKLNQKLYDLKTDKVINGEVIATYQNGKVEIKSHYHNGLKDGKEEWYLESGQLWYSRLYKKGVLVFTKWNEIKKTKQYNLKQFENKNSYHGINITSTDSYNENGAKNYSKYFSKKDNATIEEWYYASGNLKKKYTHLKTRVKRVFYNKDGSLKNGISKTYYKNKKLKSIMTFSEGSLVKEILYSKSKNIESSKIYYKDILIKYKKYKYGKLFSIKIFNKIDGSLTKNTIYDKDGYKNSSTTYKVDGSKIHIKYNFKNIKWYVDTIVHGKIVSTKWYDDNGKLKNGVYRSHYSNGHLSYVANYHDGVIDGAEKTYYKNGVIKQLSHYRHGQSVGLTEKFDKFGNILTKIYRDNDSNIIKKVIYNYYADSDEKKKIVKEKVTYDGENRITEHKEFKKDLKKRFNDKIDTSI